MNLDGVKAEIKKHLNHPILLEISGLRNRYSKEEGIISAVYPNLFLVTCGCVQKSISYADIITGEVKVKYL